MTGTHLLIVEDEMKIATLLEDYLTKAGFKVSCLSRGDGAVEEIRRISPALLLLDIMLPGRDGITICRDVRKFSDLPIILVTAKVEEVDRLIGLEMGADDYICKPFSPREVVARVKAVLRRSQPTESSHRLVAGPIILEQDTRRVTINGAPINLTPSEFNLLNVLIASPERVFSRSELLDKVLGYQFQGYDRTIDSHVKNLRKKFAEHIPGKDTIQTIYGVGYRLSM